MNILTIVFTMLMLMAILTYSRLHSFLQRATFQSEYRQYVRKDRQDTHHAATKKLREKTNESESDRDSSNDNGKTVGRLNPYVPFYLFVKKSEREKHQKKFEQNLTILKRLIECLYGTHPFYLEMKNKRPDFLDQLLNQLMEATDKVYGEKLKKVEDISTVEIEDPELKEVLYKMLHGSRTKKNVEDEFLEKEGYLSLLNFITLSTKKISIYLASGEVLMSLYGDKEIVEKIISIRSELHVEVAKRSGEDLKQEKDKATLKFKDAISGLSFLGNDEGEVLDFGVTSTDPDEYQ